MRDFLKTPELPPEQWAPRFGAADPCPRPQIGKPAHCGIDQCRYAHEGDPVRMIQPATTQPEPQVPHVLLVYGFDDDGSIGEIEKVVGPFPDRASAHRVKLTLDHYTPQMVSVETLVPPRPEDLPQDLPTTPVRFAADTHSLGQPGEYVLTVVGQQDELIKLAAHTSRPVSLMPFAAPSGESVSVSNVLLEELWATYRRFASDSTGWEDLVGAITRLAYQRIPR